MSLRTEVRCREIADASLLTNWVGPDCALGSPSEVMPGAV